MSSLVSAIVNDAFREGNFIASGESPTATEEAEGIARLNTYIASLFGTCVGTKLYDWYVPHEQNPDSPLRVLTPDGSSVATTDLWRYPPPNSRVLAKVTSNATIYFPANPPDGARIGFVDVGSTGSVTLNGNGRLVEGASSVAAPGSATEWFYRADLGNWIKLNKALTSAEEVPFPEEFDDLLITGLAIRLAARFGVSDIDEAIVSRNQYVLSQLKARYAQTEGVPASVELRSTFTGAGFRMEF